MPGGTLSHLPLCVSNAARWVPFILVAFNKRVSLEAGQVVTSVSVYANYGTFHSLVQFYD